MLKAVLFDLDGTVLDTLPDLNACMNEALARFGCPAITLEQTRRYVGNGGLLFAERALPPARRAEAEHFYKDVYCPVHFGCKNERTRPFAGEGECLAALRDAGMRLAVVTNKSQRAADELGATELGVSPAEAAFVGDGETDVQTAKNAGMRSVSVLWGYRGEAELRAAGAERFARSYAELQGILLAM